MDGWKPPCCPPLFVPGRPCVARLWVHDPRSVGRCQAVSADNSILREGSISLCLCAACNSGARPHIKKPAPDNRRRPVISVCRKGGSGGPSEPNQTIRR